jgi:REP element-mobilizing transposase RayT
MEFRDAPFVLFITWTCYGTWLPGDDRGHASSILVPIARYQKSDRRPGRPYAVGDPRTRKRATALQKHSTARLTASVASEVAKSLLETSVARGWSIPRAAILFNHVHVVITKCPHDGPIVRRLLKGRAHADLHRSYPQREHWWTKGGSDRYLNDDASIAGAIRYVANQFEPLAEIVDGRILSREEMDSQDRRRKAGGS